MKNMIFLQGLRIAFVFCLYFLTLACYLAPVLILKYWGYENSSISSPDRALRNKLLGLRCISFCNCTAAGIFLSICFLGLLPYVGEKFHSILKTLDVEVKFPIAECIVVLGFFITLVIEQSFYAWKERRDACLHDDVEQGQGLLEECEMQDLSDDPSLTHEDHNQRLVGEMQSEITSSTHHVAFLEENQSSAADGANISSDAELGHGHNHLSLFIHKGNGFSFFILAFATSLHSIFEGITLGLQTDISKAVHVFIAIIIHECLVALALGVNSTKLRYPFTSYLKFAALYSAVIPIGLLIGVAVEHAPGLSSDICSGILQGLAAGIFLHVIFQDFLPLEFSNKQDRLLKVLSLFFGFVLISVITFFLNEM